MKLYFFTVKHWFADPAGYCVRADNQAEAWAKLLADNDPAELVSAVLFDLRSPE